LNQPALEKEPPVSLKDQVLEKIVDNLESEGVTVSVNGGPAVPIRNLRAMLDDMATVASTADQVATRRDNVVTSAPQSLTNASKEKLKQFVARIERLEDEKTELAGQLKEVYGEAKALGYDTKAVRALIRLRKIPKGARDEAQMVLDLYCEAVGEI
jgi:uncharacterized protein (UPF0335 family)